MANIPPTPSASIPIPPSSTSSVLPQRLRHSSDAPSDNDDAVVDNGPTSSSSFPPSTPRLRRQSTGPDRRTTRVSFADGEPIGDGVSNDVSGANRVAPSVQLPTATRVSPSQLSDLGPSPSFPRTSTFDNFKDTVKSAAVQTIPKFATDLFNLSLATDANQPPADLFSVYFDEATGDVPLTIVKPECAYDRFKHEFSSHCNNAYAREHNGKVIAMTNLSEGIYKACREVAFNLGGKAAANYQELLNEYRVLVQLYNAQSKNVANLQTEKRKLNEASAALIDQIDRHQTVAEQQSALYKCLEDKNTALTAQLAQQPTTATSPTPVVLTSLSPEVGQLLDAWKAKSAKQKTEIQRLTQITIDWKKAYEEVLSRQTASSVQQNVAGVNEAIVNGLNVALNDANHALANVTAERDSALAEIQRRDQSTAISAPALIHALSATNLLGRPSIAPSGQHLANSTPDLSINVGTTIQNPLNFARPAVPAPVVPSAVNVIAPSAVVASSTSATDASKSIGEKERVRLALQLNMQPKSSGIKDMEAWLGHITQMIVGFCPLDDAIKKQVLFKNLPSALFEQVSALTSPGVDYPQTVKKVREKFCGRVHEGAEMSAWFNQLQKADESVEYYADRYRKQFERAHPGESIDTLPTLKHFAGTLNNDNVHVTTVARTAVLDPARANMTFSQLIDACIQAEVVSGKNDQTVAQRLSQIRDNEASFVQDWGFSDSRRTTPAIGRRRSSVGELGIYLTEEQIAAAIPPAVREQLARKAEATASSFSATGNAAFSDSLRGRPYQPRGFVRPYRGARGGFSRGGVSTTNTVVPTAAECAFQTATWENAPVGAPIGPWSGRGRLAPYDRSVYQPASLKRGDPDDIPNAAQEFAQQRIDASLNLTMANPSGGKLCTYCHQPGHVIFDCPEPSCEIAQLKRENVAKFGAVPTGAPAATNLSGKEKGASAQ